MWSNSKTNGLTIAGLVALAAFAPDATATIARSRSRPATGPERRHQAIAHAGF